MTNELPSTIDRQVTRLCAEGNRHLGSRRFDAAVLSYKAAFDLLPWPKERWPSTQEILASITDACFLKGDLRNAREAIDAVMQCAGAVDDPSIHLRLGKVLYELGQLDEAARELALAYRAAGERLFDGQDEKYVTLARRHELQ